MRLHGILTEETESQPRQHSIDYLWQGFSVYMVYDPMLFITHWPQLKYSISVGSWPKTKTDSLHLMSPSHSFASPINNPGFALIVKFAFIFFIENTPGLFNDLNYLLASSFFMNCNIKSTQNSFSLQPLFPPSFPFKHCTMCGRLGLELPACPTPGHWRPNMEGQ